MGKSFVRDLRPTVQRGDSLGWKCPEHVITLFKESFEFSCLRDSSAVVSSSNYMLNDWKYKRQEDLYSCGCYVIWLCSEFAIHRGFAPKST